jgi:hypothetical protein
MTYGIELPRVDPQLQGDLGGAIPPTRGSDCSIKTIQGLVRWATRGATVPKVSAIRQAIGAPAGGITLAQVKAGYAAYGVNAVRLLNDAELIAALAAGQAVHVCVNYGWVNDNAAYLSGQDDFRGGHGLAVYGLESFAPQAKRFTQWLDPLGDGRRPELAKQVVTARLSDVQGAMAAFSSFGAVAVTQIPAPDCSALEKLAMERGDAIVAAQKVLEEAP